MSRNQYTEKNYNIRQVINHFKGWNSLDIWDTPNKSKFHAWRSKEHIEVRECLLFFGTESSVFHFSIQKYKYQDLQNCNFAWCENLSLTLREERGLRVFENRVLRSRLWPKRDEVTGKWRKPHNEELTDLYSSPNTIRVTKSSRIKWAGHVACSGVRRNAFGVLVGKSERKIPFGRPRPR